MPCLLLSIFFGATLSETLCSHWARSMRAKPGETKAAAEKIVPAGWMEQKVPKIPMVVLLFILLQKDILSKDLCPIIPQCNVVESKQTSRITRIESSVSSRWYVPQKGLRTASQRQPLCASRRELKVGLDQWSRIFEEAFCIIPQEQSQDLDLYLPILAQYNIGMRADERVRTAPISTFLCQQSLRDMST